MKTAMNLVLIAGLALSGSAFAQEASEIRIEKQRKKTGAYSIVHVGDCNIRTTTDVEGNLAYYYDFTSVYCNQYEEYDAEVTGSFWQKKSKKVEGTEIYYTQTDDKTESYSDILSCFNARGKTLDLKVALSNNEISCQ